MFCANPRPGRFFSSRCRKCKPCLALRQEDWTARTVWEVHAAEKAVFITLTFRRKPKDGYAEFQRYAKRVRSALGRKVGKICKLRFVCASEFGEKRGRYHLHGVMCVHGGNPSVHFFRGRWSAGITHARVIRGGNARRVSRYVSKYLAKAGRIRASNGFGSSELTIQRIWNGTGTAIIAEAFPGAQIVAIKEEGQTRSQRAPYAVRKRFKRASDLQPRNWVRRSYRPQSNVFNSPIWGDHIVLDSVTAYNAEAEFQLSRIEAFSEDG